MRDGRFTNSKAGMLVLVDYDDARAFLAEDRAQHGTGEAVAENGHLEIVFCFLYYHRLLPVVSAELEKLPTRSQHHSLRA